MELRTTNCSHSHLEELTKCENDVMKFCVTLPKFLSFGIKYQGRGIPWNIISLYKQKQKYVDRLPLPDNSGPLQEVMGDITTGHPTGPVEVSSMNLPKREELLFRVVFALPNTSRIGLAWKVERYIIKPVFLTVHSINFSVADPHLLLWDPDPGSKKWTYGSECGCRSGS